MQYYFSAGKHAVHTHVNMQIYFKSSKRTDFLGSLLVMFDFAVLEVYKAILTCFISSQCGLTGPSDFSMLWLPFLIVYVL